MNLVQAERVKRAFSAFCNVDLDTYFRSQAISPAEAALALARDVSLSVPAYARFLRANGIDATALSDIQSLQLLPLSSKDNYIRQYELSMLCRHGRLEACDMVAMSSGSTGTPTCWPRFVEDELRVARRFEQVFLDSFAAESGRTLAVICFALGSWVGGLYSIACCRHLAAKGFPITVIAPGNHLEEIHRAVTGLGQYFDQMILLGYPPFIKDVIDAGLARGLDWKAYNTKFIFAGEVFTEEWRALVYSRSRSTDYACDSASLYGTADAGVLGVETPLTISIRRFLAQHPNAAREIFGQPRLPSLMQYDPWARYFEVVEGRLVFTGDNGVPLIRYCIGDEGGVIEYENMMKLLDGYHYDPRTALPAKVVRQLPFVFVFGRSHFAVSYYGANVYPENVASALDHEDVQSWLTGKFVLHVSEGEDGNRRLFVTVEQACGAMRPKNSVALLQGLILRNICRVNSEFVNYVPQSAQTPVIEFKPYGDPQWFPWGVKHRYTRGS